MDISVEPLFDPNTSTLTYIVSDANTKDCIVIDPVLNYDANFSVIKYDTIEKIETVIKEKNLNLLAAFDTHVHVILPMLSVWLSVNK